MMNPLIPKRLDIVPEQISLNPGGIIDLLGERNHHSKMHLSALVDHLIGESLKTMEPAGGYVTARALPGNFKDEIIIPGSCFKTGRIVRKMLQGSESFVFFIASAGCGPEDLARSLMNDGHYLEGYIVDLIGSALVESVVHLIHAEAREEAATEGKRVTNRYSPGYCGWDVGEQQKLFNLFPPGFCGVLLFSSSLMLPIKSVSGLIGSGKSVIYREYTCEICSMIDCIFRRTRSFSPLVE